MTFDGLNPISDGPVGAPSAHVDRKGLNQFFTPAWAAEALVQRHFAGLSAKDTVIEPSCGDGRFLMAIPDDVDAYGVDLDPLMAARAARNSGREVITGDFCKVDLPRRPTVILGNPPFDMTVFDQMLDRCHELLENEGTAAFLLPVYTFQTASRVVGYQKRWSLSQEMLPRNLFAGLQCPIMWATFKKQRQTVVSGLFLYAELDALQGLKRDMRRLMVGNDSTPTCWRDIVQLALQACGGRASLTELYGAIESNRPTANQWWREQVRKVAARHFLRVGAGEYALPLQAAA